MNELSYEVHVELDVFSMLMLNLIFGDLDDTFIVTTKGDWMLLLESKL
jgi:hypothetical protein